MTNPETLSPLAQQDFTNVVNAAGYLGRGDVLLFPSGSEVALYRAESQDGSANQQVLESTYTDIDAFTSQAAQEIGGAIDTSANSTPEDAQATLDSLFALAAAQNKFMGILNAPDLAGQSSFYVLFAESDSTVGDNQVISRQTDGSLPLVTGFDMGSHDIYSALVLARQQLDAAH